MYLVHLWNRLARTVNLTSKMKWSDGDKVMAKWPGSKLYYHAVVKSIDEVEEEAKVLFSDGSELNVPLKNISAESRFTPRSRSKSPARSRRRSRSPGRSPGRKSAIGQQLKSSPKQRSQSRSQSRGRPSKLVTSQSDEKKAIIFGSPTSVTSITTNSKIDINSGYMMTRQRTKTIISTTTEENGRKVNHQNSPAYPAIKEYGGVVGSFLIYFIAPMLSLWIVLVCVKADWSMSKFKTSMIPSDLASYTNVYVVGVILAFLLFHVVLYILPLGHIIRGPPVSPNGDRLEYRISARYALVISALAYGLMCYYHVPVNYVPEHLFQFAFTTAMLCYVANFLLYAWSFYVPKRELNPSGTTGSFIYDSFIGRVVHPRIGRLFDWKVFLYRPSMIGWMVLVWITFHTEYANNNGKLSPQLWMIAVSQMVYIYLEFFFNEDMCVYMFDIKDESLGFPNLVGELIMVPFLYSIPVRYIAANPIQMSNPTLLALIALFCVGIYLVCWSEYQKTKFRQNPTSFPAHASLPSSRIDGERLLVSGLWGFLRHPNYLGEILIALSWSLACGFTHAITWFYPLFVIGLLCDRTERLEKRSSLKHGHAWKVYCQNVPYRILPGIF